VRTLLQKRSTSAGSRISQWSPEFWAADSDIPRQVRSSLIKVSSCSRGAELMFSLSFLSWTFSPFLSCLFSSFSFADFLPDSFLLLTR
jgi:hypothetical protein